MRKISLVLAVFTVLVMSSVAGAQSYRRPYYIQVPLPDVQKRAYFLENRTGSPLKVTLLISHPSGVKEDLIFEIDSDHEVYVSLPLVCASESSRCVIAKVKSAIAYVAEGKKIKATKVRVDTYDREEESGLNKRGWIFFL